jgi:hypothetical protein
MTNKAAIFIRSIRGIRLVGVQKFAQVQIDALAEIDGLPKNCTIRKILSENQSPHTFVRLRQIFQAVVNLCTEVASEIRGSSIELDCGELPQ